MKFIWLILLGLLEGCGNNPIQTNELSIAPPETASPYIWVTTPNYLGHKFQALYRLDLSPNPTPVEMIRGLPIDILQLSKNLILDRALNSSLIWTDPDVGQILKQVSIGKEGASAQSGVQLDDTRLAISFFNQNQIWVVSKDDGHLIQAIDVSSFANADGIAEMGPLVVVGEFLVASLLGIDQKSFSVPTPTQAGLLIYRKNSLSFLHRIPLQAGNVYDRIQVNGMTLTLLEAGNFNAKDGMISQYTLSPDSGDVVSKTALLRESEVDQEFGDCWWDEAQSTLYVIGSQNLLSRNDAVVMSYQKTPEGVFKPATTLLGQNEGGVFRSLTATSQPSTLWVTSPSQSHTGIFRITLDASHTTPFIPFPADAPPERCTLIQ